MRKITLLVALLAILGLLYSCSESSSVNNSETSNNLETVSINMLNDEIELPFISDATIDKEIGFHEDYESTRVDNTSDRRRDGNLGNDTSPLRKILAQLDLSNEQIQKIVRIINANNDCEKAALAELRRSEMRIMQNANNIRNRIIAQYRAGELSREEAAKMIERLNQDTRNKILNNPYRKIVREKLMECQKVLLDNIRSVLDREQLALFNKYLERWHNSQKSNTSDRRTRE